MRPQIGGYLLYIHTFSESRTSYSWRTNCMSYEPCLELSSQSSCKYVLLSCPFVDSIVDKDLCQQIIVVEEVPNYVRYLMVRNLRRD